MAKQRLNKQGFTLMEMLLVLFIISMSLLLVPFIKPSNTVLFLFDIQRLKAMIQETQIDAATAKENKTLTITSTQAVNEQRIFSFVRGMHCTSTHVVFTAQFTVTRAQTIHCSCQNQQRDLVIELGNGVVYVR